MPFSLHKAALRTGTTTFSENSFGTWVRPSIQASTPYSEDREAAGMRFDSGTFFVVFVDAHPETCKARDPKGLYARASRGEIQNLTGFHDPYEPPMRPDFRFAFDRDSPIVAVEEILEHFMTSDRKTRDAREAQSMR